MDMKIFHKEVVSMQQRLKSYLDMPNDSKAQAIINSFQKLEDEVQVGRTGATIQNRIKEIQTQIKAAYDSGVISWDHFDALEDWTREYLQKTR